MKKYLLIVGLFVFSCTQVVFANNDAYNGFVPLDSYNVTQTQCTNASLQAGKKARIQNMRNTGTNGLYTYGNNTQGYSIQFLCLANKRVAFIIVNGSSFNEQKRIYNIFEKAFKSTLNKKH